jgi:hypothetical protein
MLHAFTRQRFPQMNTQSSILLLLIALLAAASVADAAAAKKGNTGGGKKDKEVVSKDKGKFSGDKNDPVIGIDLGNAPTPCPPPSPFFQLNSE